MTQATSTGQGIQIKSIAFSVYPVSDMARSRKFYEETLGLKPASTFGEMWQEYDLGEGTFGIVLMNEHAPECFKNTRGTTIAFEVMDLKVAEADMRAKGVPVIYGPADFPTCGMFVIEDPDKNLVTFHELAPERKNK